MKEKSAWKEAAWIFGLSRLIILAIFYLAIAFFPLKSDISVITYVSIPPCSGTTGHESVQVDYGPLHLKGSPQDQQPDDHPDGLSSHRAINCFLLSGLRWDATHYLEVAFLGYNHNAPLSVFFPLFPLLIHTLGALFGGSIYADYGAGLIIANICFYLSLVLFYKLLDKDFGHTIARRSLLFLAFYPYTVFFSIGYTESLFLLLTLAVFIFLRRGNPLDWWLAGLCGCLAGLTRATGIVLIVPMLVVFLQRFGLRTLLRRENWQNNLHALFSMALVPIGLACYLFYLWKTFGNPFVISIEEAELWHRYTDFPWVGILNDLQGLFSVSPHFTFDLFDTLFVFIPITALIIGWKRIPLHWSLFSVVMILFFLSQPCKFFEPLETMGLMSAPHYMLAVFPIYPCFALWSESRFTRRILSLFFLFFFIFFTMIFALGNWLA